MRIVIFIFWILTGIASGVVASDKGHGFGSWAFAGLLLGPLGLIAAAGLSDQKLREYIRRSIEPQSIREHWNAQDLLEQSPLDVDSKPRLLMEGSFNSEHQVQYNLNDKYVGDFLLGKSASQNQIWGKILELLEFRSSDIAFLADRSKSNLNLSLTGGRAYKIRKSDGKKLALAYAKQTSDMDILHWQVKLY